jgi:para-nitrobenzyl esterase
MLSGCNYTSDGPSLEQAEQIGLQIQQRLGAHGLQELRNLPADRILAIQTENQVGARVQGVRINGPIVDRWFLPGSKQSLLRSGQVAAVPIIASYTTDDIDIAMNPITAVTTVGQFQSVARTLYGEDADAFLRLYPVASDADVPRVAHEAARTAGFEAGARYCASAQTNVAHAPAYLIQFDRKHPYVPGVRIADQNIATIGAYHTSDVPYWLGTLDRYNALRPTRAWTAWDRRLSAAMVEFLISFANDGQPRAPGIAWPAWSAAAERKLVVGDRAQVEPLNRERLEWHARHPLPTPFDARPSRPRD